jgi:hypothetical protein
VVLAPVLAAIGVLPAEPLEVYRAWLDSAGHTAFTGAQAEVQAQVGGGLPPGTAISRDGPCRWRPPARPPAGQGAEYAQGWADHYFSPMMRYFSGKKGG